MYLADIVYLKEQVRFLQVQLFGRSSETKITPDDNPAVSIARMPDQIIPKSMATPGLITHVMTAKFVDALPFYRQEK